VTYKRLFVLLEGDDDERFLRSIIVELFRDKFDSIIPFQYAQKNPKMIDKFIRSIRSMNADYLYLGDINNEPCISGKKSKIESKLREMNNSKMVIVVREIESWYLAGLDDSNCKKLKVSIIRNTDNLTKEKFFQLKPKSFSSKKDFMIEILKHFSLNTAVRKNKSFKYFIQKYIPK